MFTWGIFISAFCTWKLRDLNFKSTFYFILFPLSGRLHDPIKTPTLGRRAAEGRSVARCARAAAGRPPKRSAPTIHSECLDMVVEWRLEHASLCEISKSLLSLAAAPANLASTIFDIQFIET